MSLGDLARDPKRLDEAVATCPDALEVYTRDAMPTDCARTQMNLAMALLRMGEFEKSASRVQQARVAVLGGLEVKPNNPDTRDTLKQIDEAIAKLGMAASPRV